MDHQSLVGQQLGKFHIESELGRGAMGIVFRARDNLDRTVALKVLLPELTINQDFVERFKREAKSAANLHHPHIITIYEIGEIDNLHYISMFFIEGEPLTTVMHREGAMSIERVVELLDPVAQALDRAHNSGIIHRDIKPSNIMLDKEHKVYLTDFGLARGADPAAVATAAGMVLGTPEYMSPEQAKGLLEIDPPTDIYALGVVVYQMLTGALPFSGETTMLTLFARLRQPPRPLRELRPNISPAAEAAVMKALELEPQDRYARASELIAALRAAAAGTTPPPPLPTGKDTIVTGRKNTQPPPGPDTTVTINNKHPSSGAGSTSYSNVPAQQEDDSGQKQSCLPLIIIGGILIVLLVAGGGAIAAGLIPSVPGIFEEPEGPEDSSPGVTAEPTMTATDPLDNQIVFVTDNEGNRDIYVMDADGNNPTPLIERDADDTTPAVSPDGTQIAFVSEGDIYVANVDGSPAQNLTNGEGDNNYPTWSPDGTQLGFVRDDTIMVMNADGSDPTPITDTEETGNYRDLDWSPDGTQFVFELAQDIHLINRDGSDLQNLTNSEERDVEPVWSPDGEQIAFASDRDADSLDIYVMEANGRNATRLTEDEHVDSSPTWAPDGTQIAFRSGRNRHDEIYVIDSNGGEPVQLTDNNVDNMTPHWSP